ncbi:MAG: two-component system, cell cycle response regulator [Cryptosporangiaceae bacterium]|nr:two-component system, cell cycle response regulator [Cryptosporangiaceae bacterium]
MTLRGRLTAAFLAVVLGPVVVSSAAVALSSTRATESRETERLNAAANGVITSMKALCERAHAAAEALAATANGAGRAAAPQIVVARGLVGIARIEDGSGKIVAQAGQLPLAERTVPWGDCRSRLPAAAPLIAAAVEMRSPAGKLVGRARTAFSVDQDVVTGIAESAGGVDVTLLDGSEATISTLPKYRADQVARAAATANRVIPSDLRVAAADNQSRQPLRFAVSTTHQSLGELYGALVLVVLVVAGLAILAAWYLSRSLTRPLADVAQTAERVAAGDLGARAPVRGKDEVARLATTFNRMTRDLQAYVSALTASRDQLRGNLALIGDTLSSTHDLDRILEVILETVMAATGAQAGVVLLTDRSAREWPGVLVGQCGFGMSGRGVEVADLRVPIGAGVLGGVAASGEPRLGRVREGSADLAASEPRCRTYIAVPFSGSGRSNESRGIDAPPQILGVLALYDRLGADDFDDGDLVTLRTFAGQAAVAVENVLLHQESERLSLTDSVTGLWNYRYLRVSLYREVERAVRFARPLSVVKMQLDRYREIGDTHGLSAAEAVLSEVARQVLAMVREVDLVFRRSESDFVILLPETAADGACRAAERFCAGLRESPIQLGSGDPGLEIACTVSVGIAVFPEHAPDAEALLGRADSALRSAIAAGRDTWRMSGEQDPRPGAPALGALVGGPGRQDASVNTGIERG